MSVTKSDLSSTNALSEHGASADVDRLRSVYEHRAQRLQGSTSGERPNPGELHMAQSLERALLKMLGHHGKLPLRSLDILDVGCGTGGLLMGLVVAGADPCRLHGVDLMEDRIARANSLCPTIDFRQADARELPYEDGTFDFVLQCTVFTSILDLQVKRRIASEMLRVLRKPCGLIAWYDFWINRPNDETKGIRRRELTTLFPDCTHDVRSLTLAPPLVRRLAPHMWWVCDLLEALKFLNTHLLAAITPRG